MCRFACHPAVVGHDQGDLVAAGSGVAVGRAHPAAGIPIAEVPGVAHYGTITIAGATSVEAERVSHQAIDRAADSCRWGLVDLPYLYHCCVGTLGAIFIGDGKRQRIVASLGIAVTDNGAVARRAIPEFPAEGQACLIDRASIGGGSGHADQIPYLTHVGTARFGARRHVPHENLGGSGVFCVLVVGHAQSHGVRCWAIGVAGADLRSLGIGDESLSVVVQIPLVSGDASVGVRRAAPVKRHLTPLVYGVRPPG